MAHVVDKVMAVRQDGRPGTFYELAVNGVADHKVRMLLEVARKAAHQGQQKAEEGQQGKTCQSAAAKREPSFRQAPDGGIQPVRHSGAERRRKGRMQPSSQEQEHRERQVQQPCAQQGACGQGTSGGHGAGGRKASMAYFIPKKRKHWPQDTKKSLATGRRRGDLGVLDTGSGKRNQKRPNPLP